MPTLKKVNPEETPDLFYLGREVTTEWASLVAYVAGAARLYNGRAYVCLEDHTSDTFAVDFADGKWKQEKLFNLAATPQDDPIWTIYDVKYEVPSVAVGAKLKRRVKNGSQSVHLEPDLISYYYDTGSGDELIATARIIPQYYQGDWQDYTKKLDDYIGVDENGHLIGEGTQGAFSWTIDIGFEKWTVNVVAPGFTTRAVWEITFTALGQQLMSDGDGMTPNTLKFSTEDYTGNILDDEGVAVRTVIFEPDGSVDGLVIDPSLSIEIDAVRVGANCDGFSVVIYTNQYQSYAYICNLEWSANRFADHLAVVWDDGGGDDIYSLFEDPNMVAIVKEETPNRAVVEFIGNFYSPTAAGYITNSTQVKCTYTFYDDHFTKRVEWERSGSVTLGSSSVSLLASLDPDITCTAYYENSDTESAGSPSTEYNSADYLVNIGDAGDNIANALMMVLDSNLGSDLVQYCGSPAYFIRHKMEDTTYAAGTTDVTFMCQCDFTAREAAQRIYSVSDRVSFGNQWKDLVGPAITDGLGAQETDWVIPLHLGTGICTDGAQHLENDGDSKIRLTADRDRVKHHFLINAKDCFKVGDPSSPTDLLVGHWKCDDDAASTTVTDETGNYDGTASENTVNLSIDDAVQGKGFQLVAASSQSVSITAALAGITDKNVFTIIFRARRDTTGATSENIFSLGVNADNYAYFRFSSTTNYVQMVANINGSAFTSTATDAETDVNEWNTYALVFNLNDGYYKILCNGKVLYTANVTETWGTTPTGMRFGKDQYSAYGDVSIDNVSLLNAAVHPFGSFFTDEGGDFANPHERILFHEPLDNLSETTPAIGSGSISVNGSPSLADGPFGANTAMQFDASGEIVTAQTSGNFNPEKGAISFWFKSLSAQADNTNRVLFGNWGGSDGDQDFGILKYQGDNVLYFFIYTNSVLHEVGYNVAAISARCNWQALNYYLFKWDDTNDIDGTYHMALYINSVRAVPSTTIAVSSAWTTSTVASNFGIGNDYAGTTRYANGLISRFTIVDDPRTPEIWTAIELGPLLLSKVGVS